MTHSTTKQARNYSSNHHCKRSHATQFVHRDDRDTEDSKDSERAVRHVKQRSQYKRR